jgi:hypothetical protein
MAMYGAAFAEFSTGEVEQRGAAAKYGDVMAKYR